LSASPAGAPSGDAHWLAAAIELSRRCPPSATAFSVGALLVAADGAVITTGYSRETDPLDHAEEAALAKVPELATAPGASGSRPLAGTTLYSSLEPCAMRASRTRTCAELIIAAGIVRVVIAWREPPLFVPGGGAAVLQAAGVTVVDLPEFAAAARAVNAHLAAG
jgi:diaminohydroxyphosphoribosylaminopyrimidine deaminase / 5-amino-6-(5-phosphoribosylamino)uracil reductase